MKCAVHTDVDATGYCRNCGKAMCALCVRPVRDVLYCEDCLATIVGIPSAAAGTAPSAQSVSGGPIVPGAVPVPPQPGMGPSPVLAFFLGFLPGLGAFYNEQYGKGIIHLAIFLFLFIIGVDGSLNGGAAAALWVCLAGLWVYMPIDALPHCQGAARGTNFARSTGVLQQGPSRRSVLDHRRRRAPAPAQLRLVSVLAPTAILARSADRRRCVDVPKSPGRRGRTPMTPVKGASHGH